MMKRIHVREGHIHFLEQGEEGGCTRKALARRGTGIEIKDPPAAESLRVQVPENTVFKL